MKSRYLIWFSKEHKMWLCDDTHTFINYLPRGGFVAILRKLFSGHRNAYTYYAKGKTPFAALWTVQKYVMKQNGELK